MEPSEKGSVRPEERPPCFGDEIKFVAYMENNTGSECECARCPSENDCGEYILFKCSRELIF